MKNIVLNNINLIAYDFDGVMTDNKVYVDQNGVETVQVSRGDGLGVAEIRKLGYKQIIISTEKNPVVARRAKKLGIECFHGVDNKLKCLKDFTDSNGIKMEQVCFVGNDINDLEVMSAVGFKACPKDAYIEIINIADIIFSVCGGQGVIRELFYKLKKE